MTEKTLKQGMAILFTMWPHRAPNEETVTLLSGLYREALGELSDAAWLGACKSAMRTCKHFPVPAELLEMAETYAEAVVYERLAIAEQRRIAAAEDMGRLMLSSGTLTPGRVAENAEAIAGLSSSMRDAGRDGGGERERRDDFWAKESRDRARRHRHLNRSKPVRR